MSDLYSPSPVGPLGTSVEVGEMGAIAEALVIGRALGAGTGVPTTLTATQLRALMALTTAGAAPSANAVSLLSAADYAAMKVLLGLTIGTNVQAYSAILASLVSNGVPGTSGLAILLGATAAANRTNLGFPSQFIIGPGQRAFRGHLQHGANFQTIAAKAHFNYLGYFPLSVAMKYAGCFAVTTTSVSDDNGEVGFFTTPLPGGCKANQTLTPLSATAFKTVWDTFVGQTSQYRRNSVAMAENANGVHLWAGARWNNGGARPIVLGVTCDGGQGYMLETAGAAAFDGLTTYAGVIPTSAGVGSSTAIGPWLYAECD